MGYDPFDAVQPAGHLCSNVAAEPLSGSSRTGSTFILYEHPGPWSHDILDGGTFNAEETKRLETLPGLYLIRKPRRAGRKANPKRHAYLVFCDYGVTEHLMVRSIDELLELDLSGPYRNPQAREEPMPQLLVCTHAKRDRCCAIKGRPIAQDLVEAFPGAPIWECSHTKGHRFAPSMMLFPWAYFYGRLNTHAARDVYNYALADQLFLPGNRGRGVFDSRGQVAELAVLEQLFDAGETPRPGLCAVETHPEHTIVTHQDGRKWLVTLEQREAHGVIPSCGDQPKSTKVWVPSSIRRA